MTYSYSRKLLIENQTKKSRVDMESSTDMTIDNFVQISRDVESFKNPLNKGVDLADVIKGNSFLHGQYVSHGFSPSKPLVRSDDSVK